MCSALNACIDKGHNSKQGLQVNARNFVNRQEWTCSGDKVPGDNQGQWKQSCFRYELRYLKERHRSSRWGFFFRRGIQTRGCEKGAKGTECVIWLFLNLCFTEVVNEVCTVVAKTTIHEGEGRCSAMTHHGWRPKTKTRGDIKLERAMVTETEKVVVTRVDTELSSLGLSPRPWMITR